MTSSLLLWTRWQMPPDVVPFTVIFFRWARSEADDDEPTPTAAERGE